MRPAVLVRVLACAWVLWASGWMATDETYKEGLHYYDAFESKGACMAELRKTEVLWRQKYAIVPPAYRCLPSDLGREHVLSIIGGGRQ